MLYDNFTKAEFEGVNKAVEKYYDVIEGIVTNLTEPYLKSLNDLNNKVVTALEDEDNPITNSELESMSLKLSTYIYSASSLTERLGVKDDISKAIYKEVYNNTRLSMETGTVADKNVQAELNSQKELITNICYSRAYKIARVSIDAANETLGTCKKILTLRIKEMELSNVDTNS